MKTKLFVLGCLALLGATCPAGAKEMILDAVPFDGKKVRLDGLLKEWPKPILISERIKGGGGKDPEARGLVGYDDDNLYVGMRITDAKLIRTSKFGQSEDRAVLKLAFPRTSGGHKAYEISLYAGVPGKSAGAVKVSGIGTISGAKIVEAPDGDGYSFEASIPWSTFSEAKRMRSGLRGALVYHDADKSAQVSSIIGTTKKTGGRMPMLTIEGEYALNDALVFAKGLNPTPDHELVGNLVGGSMYERVAIYERYLTVTGWDYRGGKEFFYQDLNLQNSGDLKQAKLADFDGDGKDELLLHRKVGSAGKARYYVEIWKFQSGDAPPKPIFQHEAGIVDGEAQIINDVDISRKGKRPAVIISQGSDENIDPKEWSAPMAAEGTHPSLMPWEPVKYRRWEFSGDGFEMVEEKAGKAKMTRPGGGTRLYSGKAPSSDPLAGDASSPPPAPRPPSADELQEQVYKLYRTDRGKRAGKPRFDFVTNVSGDATPERVLVHDNDLVAFGKRFKEGNSYVFTSVGDPEKLEILSVTARDVTGDGYADVIVRAGIKAKASKQLGGKTVTRHGLFVYKVQQHAITRVFAAETGRSLEGDMVLAGVRFIPVGRGLDIELLPGMAVGWSSDTYPFPEDRAPYGGLEPLLLPWTDQSPKRYSYKGSEFEQR